MLKEVYSGPEYSERAGIIARVQSLFIPETTLTSLQAASIAEYEDSEMDEFMRYVICSPTAVCIACRLLNDENIDYAKFLRKIFEYSQFTCPYSYIIASVGGANVSVPLCFSSVTDDLYNKSEKIVTSLNITPSKIFYVEEPENNGPRIYGYTIDTGWDHRGTQKFLHNIGYQNLRSECRDTRNNSHFMSSYNEAIKRHTMEEFPNNFTQLTLLSLNTRKPNWGRYIGDFHPRMNYQDHNSRTHVIVLFAVVDGIAYFIDPAGSRRDETMIQYMRVEDLAFAYNGISSLISIDS